ncbi:MAG: AIR synthase-related protein [Candidatus Bathyarchaeota archaeon]|nr:AIR synthase-related protein [Candidatus Bathyarchaeota archaeon]MCX8176834.1 AIR synthase-related protein [Candidatus Bathyarchaeota archaeon]MDW8193482.1 AIR synthase-related protein [Nitrososphaerota archaeon]
MGKLNAEELRRLIGCIRKDCRVIVPPMPGFDSGAHWLNGKCLVISTDPCIGVPWEWFGWLLIHYAASDVALFGAKPEYCTINLLGPPSTRPETFYEVMRKTCQAAEELNMAIVTGHTGTYHGLSGILGVCTAYGVVNREKLITPGGAKPGDYILCVKPVGLELVVNFALARKQLAESIFGVERTKALGCYVPMQSCVKEALLLADTGGIDAMHDATEGGLTAALNEMSEASGVGFHVKLESIPFAEEAFALSRYFGLSERQMLSMSSTGTIIAAVKPEAKERVEHFLMQNKIEAGIIGIFTDDGKRILIRKNKREPFPRKADDPYEMILSAAL